MPTPAVARSAYNSLEPSLSKRAHESLNEHIPVCKTGRVLKKLFLSLDMEEIYNHFKSGDSSPIIICQGVSVQTFNEFVRLVDKYAEGISRQMRFLDLDLDLDDDGVVSIVDWSLPEHEVVASQLKSEFVSASDSDELGMGLPLIVMSWKWEEALLQVDMDFEADVQMPLMARCGTLAIELNLQVNEAWVIGSRWYLKSPFINLGRV